MDPDTAPVDATAVDRACHAGMPAAEWRSRVLLAACYRVFFARGWSEEVFDHITLRVPGRPGEPPSCLINPFGLHYGEVAARNLVRVGLDGSPLHDTPWGVNRAGFVIHSAIHAARPDAHCIVHTHDSFGRAVDCQVGGLAMDNCYAAFLDGRIAHHDFEGVTTRTGKQPWLVAESGVAAVFYGCDVLQRACQVQALTHAMPGPTLALSDAARAQSSRHVHDADPQGDLYPVVFAAAVRRAGLSLDMRVA